MATQLGDTLNALSEPSQNPAVQTENSQILDFHQAIEAFGHDTNTNDVIHGLTNTGETIGLGRVGDSNLVTDTAQLPGDTLNGASPGMEASGIVTDAGHSVTAAGGMIEGTGTDLSNPDVVSDVVNGTPHGVNDLVNSLADNNVGDLGNAGGLGGIGGGGNGGGGNGGSGDGLVTVGAGDTGGSPILDAGVLNQPDGNSPIDIVAGNGDNLADVNALSGDNGAGSHLISGDAGAPSGSTLLNTGVLTTPDAGSPVIADIGNGANIVDATVLGNSDALQFADLGGAGADSLAGALPTAGGIADLGGITGGAPATGGDQSLIDAHTDGSDIVQVHNDSSALVGLNDHPII
jgi:hypothetical protein